MSPRGLRILILSIYHDPEPIPKTGELARELRRRGHDVTVVTAFPHYPSGRLYAGYRLALWRWEIRDNVRVLRTFIVPYHGQNGLLRMVNYTSWMLSSIQSAWLTPPCDVMYVWHPPLTVGVSAWIISKLKRVSYVYDVQDLWPESALASGILRPGPLVSFLYRLADWVYRRAPRILVVSGAAARHLQARGVDDGKVSVAHHWVDTTAFNRPPARDVRTQFGWTDRFVVMFAGNLGMVQGLETVIEAATLLRNRSDVVFVFVGDGSDRERLEALARQNRLENVRFVGHHPQEEMPTFMAAADALLVHLRRSAISDHAIPTKILSYMAAARPILCATQGAAADLIRDADAGLSVPPSDAAALAQAVTELAALAPEERQRLGRNGRAYLAAHYSKHVIIDEYERILHSVTAQETSTSMKAQTRA
jgi:colanic acid biosynthesis glycosyl transferase WcaI